MPGLHFSFLLLLPRIFVSFSMGLCDRSCVSHGVACCAVWLPSAGTREVWRSQETQRETAKANSGGRRAGASISAFFFFFSSLNPQPGTQLLKLQLPGPVNHVGRVHGEPQHRGVHLLTLLGLLGFDGLEVFLRLKKGRTQKRVRKKRFP